MVLGYLVLLYVVKRLDSINCVNPRRDTVLALFLKNETAPEDGASLY